MPLSKPSSSANAKNPGLRSLSTAVSLLICLAACAAIALGASVQGWAEEQAGTASGLTAEAAQGADPDSAGAADDDAALAASDGSSYAQGASVNGVHYNSIQKAWSAAYEKAVADGSVTFDLYEDWNIIDTSFWGRTYLGRGTGFRDDGYIYVPAMTTVNFNLHGHMINRSLANESSSYSKSDGEVICVGYGANLYLDGGDTSVEHRGNLIKGPDGISKNVWRPAGSGSTTIYGGTITGGYNTTGGGGIHAEGSANLFMTNVNLVGNMSDFFAGDGDGGALYLQGYNSLVLDNCRVDYNYAQSTGGAIFIREYSEIEMTNSTMNNNFAYGYNSRGGGAICADENCKSFTLKMTDSEMSKNLARASGGAIYSNTGKIIMSMAGSHMDGNTAKSSMPGRGDGGAIYACEGIELTLTSSSMDDNTSTRKGGAVFADADNCSITLADSTVNGNSATNYGGAVYVDNQGFIFTATDSEVNGNSTTDDGGAFYFNSEVKKFSFANGTLSNNKADGSYDGGAIYADGTLTASFTNSTVAGNSAGGYGGAVFLDAADSGVKLWSNSVMDANRAGKDGGAVYLNAHNCVVVGNLKNAHKELADGSTLSNNTAGGNGGAVYCNYAGFCINNLRFNGNTAQNGGAIYAPFFHSSNENSLAGCRIEGNTASKQGGGMYLQATLWTLRDCYVCGNTSNAGAGGIYWGPNNDYLDNGKLSLEGKVAIHDNTGTTAVNSNLYLDNYKEMYLFLQCGASDTSDIHFGVKNIKGSKGTEENLKLSTAGSWYDEPLNCDNDGYYASWTSNACGGDRIIHLVEGTKGETPAIPTTEVSRNDRYTVSTGGYTEAGDGMNYDLQSGAFNHVAYCNSRSETTNAYYYSDGYFASDARKYNEHLATMSLNLTISAFPAENGAMEKGLDGNSEANRTQFVTQLLGDIGFTHIRANDDYLAVPTTETIGALMAQKTVQLGTEGDEYTVVFVCTRGASYGKEWASNVTLGSSEEAEGFSKAGQTVFEQTVQYVKDMGLAEKLKDGKVKFWVMGYSRGAATANLCAKRLVDEYQADGNELFAYTFETPSGGYDEGEVAGSDYTCIHNIINSSDLVTKVAPVEMGIRRYGVDHYVPGGEASAVKSVTKSAEHATGVQYTRYYDNEDWGVGTTSYSSQISQMLSQLAIADSSIEFDDYFTLATVNIIQNMVISNYSQYIGISTKLITEEQTGSVTQTSYLDSFFDKLMDNGCDQRIDYVTPLTLKISDSEELTFASIQDAARLFIVLARNLSSSDMDGIISCLTDLTSKFGYLDMVSMYSDFNNWNELSDSKKFLVLSTLWNAVGVSQNGGKCIMDYIPEDMQGGVYNSFITFANFGLSLYSYDQDTSGSEVFSDKKATSEKLTLIGTFANMKNATLNHEPSLCLAWVRSFDSFYTDGGTWSTNKPSFTGTAKSTPCAWSVADDGTMTPLTTGENELASGARIVVGDAENAGAITYYELDDTMLRFNERAIQLADGTHTLEVQSYQFDAYSGKVAEYTLIVGGKNAAVPSSPADADAEAAAPSSSAEADAETDAKVTTLAASNDLESNIATVDSSYAKRTNETTLFDYSDQTAHNVEAETGSADLADEPSTPAVAPVTSDCEQNAVYYGWNDLVIHLASETEGAQIFYALDGAEVQAYDPDQGIVLRLEGEPGPENWGRIFTIYAYATLGSESSSPQTFRYELTSWGCHVVEGEATDNGDGTHTFVCAVCCTELAEGEKAQVTMQHQWTDGWCSVCGHECEHLLESGESAIEDFVFSPTCTEQGYTAHECSICKALISMDSYTDCIDHDFKLDDQLSEERGSTGENDAVYVCRMCGLQHIGKPDNGGGSSGGSQGAESAKTGDNPLLIGILAIVASCTFAICTGAYQASRKNRMRNLPKCRC